MKAKTSLNHLSHPLVDPANQLQILQKPISGKYRFDTQLSDNGLRGLCSSDIEIFQINLGKLCNMTCTHCHVDAGPDRREIMQRPEIDRCIEIIETHSSIQTVDLTGGAPEMNPHFRDLVSTIRSMGRHVIDRCNLTILLANGFQDLPEFLADHQVEVVASLPCYLEENTDSQRGSGAFQKSVAALSRLNSLGYGKSGSGLKLTLVFNPVGLTLPPDQSSLEDAYRKELLKRFGIEFTRLFTITNMPVSRYLAMLVQTGQYDQYMNMLVANFNPASVDRLMCRNTLSIGWDGSLYDCDFNQMLNLPVSVEGKTINEYDHEQLSKRSILVSQHCFGCTAGKGSSCQGETT